MKITVITVIYNVVDCLFLTLNSIRNQTYPNLEMVIIDGGSTDGTLTIAKQFLNENTVLISEPDLGIYDAMNKGVRASSGDFINFMNAGDLFYNEHVVEQVVGTIKKRSGDYYYGNVVSIFGGKPKLSIARPPSRMWRNKPFNHQSLFASRKWLQEWPFDLTYRLAADYHQSYSAWAKGAVFHHISVIIAEVDMSNGASKRSFVGTAIEKIKINWRFAPNKFKVSLFLLYNIPYLTTAYVLQRVGVFNWLMITVGGLYKKRSVKAETKGVSAEN